MGRVGGDVAADGGHGIFHSLIVWSNIADVKLDALSTAAFTHSDISSGAPRRPVPGARPRSDGGCAGVRGALKNW
ncbi:MAG TPA: hypothetical protein VMT52_19860 [Planctomycetota bacterium]|nr:hypothetical protein [Planctomycetota bacterium]